jgi:photosystem II stability/assembly factor-like uncharacterized protein
MGTDTDYIDEIEDQLVALTERGVHRGSRRAARVLSLALPALVALGVGAVSLATLHAARSTHRGGATPTAGRHGRAVSRHPTAGDLHMSPRSFTAISETAWWVLASADCSGSPCSVILRTTDGGSHFTEIPAPPGEQISQLRFADGQDGFAYLPRLWTTHDGGTTWHLVPVGGSVVDLSAAGGYVYAIVSPGAGAPSRLMRSPAERDAWSPLPAAGAVADTLWTHQHDVLVQSADLRQLLVSTDDGATFARYPSPSRGLPCTFEEVSPPVVWAQCSRPTAAGLLSVVWRSTAGGVGFHRAGQFSSRVLTPAPLGVASATTAVYAAPQLMRTGDGGASYVPLTTPGGIRTWSYLGFTDATHGVAVGYVGPPSSAKARLYYTTDGARSYHLVTLGPS